MAYNFKGQIPETGKSDYPSKIANVCNNLGDGTAGDGTVTGDIVDIEAKTNYIIVTQSTNLNDIGDKLAGIEAGATADQTDAEIKAAYENNTNTNAYTDADAAVVAATSGTNTGDQDKTNIDALGINADQVDGVEAAELARISSDNSYTGKQNFRGFTESTGTIALTGADTLNTDLHTYFYHASASTGINTITLFTTAASGRLVTVTLAVNGWGTYAPSFVSNILWSGNVEPSWSTGIDVVSFSTRDGGTTWHGFYAGRDMS